MMKIWVDSVFTPVTLVKVLPQEVLRYKTLEKDGYAAVVVGVEKKPEDKKLRKNELPFSKLVEFSINDSFVEKYKEGDVLDATALE
jgi:ribosomal protein L3